jgi:hypothetical protein
MFMTDMLKVKNVEHDAGGIFNGTAYKSLAICSDVTGGTHTTSMCLSVNCCRVFGMKILSISIF